MNRHEFAEAVKRIDAKRAEALALARSARAAERTKRKARTRRLFEPVARLPGCRMFTYFIRHGSGGAVKIGRTSDLAGRVRGLATGAPTAPRILAVLEGDHEVELHRKLALFRVHGEWFLPTAPVLAEVTAAIRSSTDELCEVIEHLNALARRRCVGRTR